MTLPAVKSWMVARLVAYITGGTTEAPLYVDPDGNLRVTLGGTNASTGAVAQGTKTATPTNGWLVTLYSAAGAALLGRLGQSASIPVVLSTEDKAALDAAATSAKQDLALAAIKQLAGFETLTAISYGGGDQTSIADGSNGIWIDTAGTLKFDTYAGASGVTRTVVVGLFPQRRVSKIYQTGSSAAGSIGYPPS